MIRIEGDIHAIFGVSAKIDALARYGCIFKLPFYTLMLQREKRCCCLSVCTLEIVVRKLVLTLVRIFLTLTTLFAKVKTYEIKIDTFFRFTDRDLQ